MPKTPILETKASVSHEAARFRHFFQTDVVKAKDRFEKVGDVYVMKKALSDELLKNAMKESGVEGYEISPTTRVLFYETDSTVQLVAVTQSGDKCISHDFFNAALFSYFSAKTADVEKRSVDGNFPLSDAIGLQMPKPDPIASGTATPRQLLQFLRQAISEMDQQQFQHFLESSSTRIGSGQIGAAYKIDTINGVTMQHPVVLKVFENEHIADEFCAAIAAEWNAYYDDVLSLPGYACADAVTLGDNTSAFVLTPYIDGKSCHKDEEARSLTWGDGKYIPDAGQYGNVLRFEIEGDVYLGVVDFDLLSRKNSVTRESVSVLPRQTDLRIPKSMTVTQAVKLFDYWKNNEEQRQKIWLAIKDRLGELIPDVRQLVELLQCRQLTEEQRQAVLSAKKEMIDADFLKEKLSFIDDRDVEKSLWNFFIGTLVSMESEELIHALQHSLFSVENLFLLLENASFNEPQRNVILSALEKKIGDIETLVQFVELFELRDFNQASRDVILKSVENKFSDWCKQSPGLEGKLLSWERLSGTDRAFVSKAIHKAVEAEKDAVSTKIAKNENTVSFFGGFHESHDVLEERVDCEEKLRK